MPKPRFVTVKLKEWFEKRGGGVTFDFDDDEYIKVRGFGTLPADFMKEHRAAFEDVDDDEITPSDEMLARRAAIRRRRNALMIVDWKLYNPDTGEQYPSPRTDETIIENIPVDLALAIENVAYLAFSTPEEKEKQLGEESGSLPQPKEEVDTNA
jgi:hypothetical protein